MLTEMEKEFEKVTYNYIITKQNSKVYKMDPIIQKELPRATIEEGKRQGRTSAQQTKAEMDTDVFKESRLAKTGLNQNPEDDSLTLVSHLYPEADQVQEDMFIELNLKENDDCNQHGSQKVEATVVMAKTVSREAGDEIDLEKIVNDVCNEDHHNEPLNTKLGREQGNGWTPSLM